MIETGHIGANDAPEVLADCGLRVAELNEQVVKALSRHYGHGQALPKRDVGVG